MMTKKLASLALALVMCLSLCVPALATVDNDDSWTMAELQSELLNYFETHDIDLQPGTPEYYEFIVQQAVEGTDSELMALPNYPLIHAYMAHYIVCADEAAQAAYASSDSLVAQSSDEISPEAFCGRSDFLNTSIEEIKQEVLAQKTVMEQTRQMPSPFASYNGSAAASYAKSYATVYNENYPNFYITGGDCTNFVSQCVQAGGKSFTGSTSSSGRVPSTSNWYCITTVDEWHGNNHYREWGYTTSWVNVGDFRAFWTSHGATYGYSSSNSGTISNVKTGSVVQLIHADTGEAYHSIIISEKSGSTAKYCGHSTNRNNVDFSTYVDDTNNNFYYYNF